MLASLGPSYPHDHNAIRRASLVADANQALQILECPPKWSARRW
jgi:hypothetical protein